MTFVPNSGPINTTMINAAFGLGEDINLYKGVRWYYPANLTTGLFSTSTIKMSDFFGKQGTDPATAGTYFANVAGSGSFTIPLYRNYIKIEIWGGGGSGGGGNGGNGGNGGDSNILGVTAGGGQGGQPGSIPVPPPPVNVSTNTGRGGQDISYDTSYTSYTLNAYAGNKDGVWSESQNNATGQGSNPTPETQTSPSFSGNYGLTQRGE
jgi:hypothetical protein